jgi:hypothetical protein
MNHNIYLFHIIQTDVVEQQDQAGKISFPLNFLEFRLVV